jgi:hypothetical protein
VRLGHNRREEILKGVPATFAKFQFKGDAPPILLIRGHAKPYRALADIPREEFRESTGKRRADHIPGATSTYRFAIGNVCFQDVEMLVSTADLGRTAAVPIRSVDVVFGS